MKSIAFDHYKSIVVLTGAGISVASGLPTYREQGGALWEDVDWKTSFWTRQASA